MYSHCVNVNIQLSSGTECLKNCLNLFLGLHIACTDIDDSDETEQMHGLSEPLLHACFM